MKTIFEKLKSIDSLHVLLFLVIMGFISFVISMLELTVLRDFKYESKGVLTDKIYIPSHTSNVTTYSSGGKVGVGTVSSSREIKFIVRYSGFTDEVSTDLDTYGKYKEGDSITVMVYKGKFFGFKSLEIK